MNTSDLPEIFKTTTETFLEISQEMHNPNNTDLLYFIFSQNFFNLFVNDLGELRKVQKENTKKVGKIESKIIEKFSWCLKKLNLKKSEYKMTLKKKEKLEKKFTDLSKINIKKYFWIILNIMLSIRTSYMKFLMIILKF
ncbi:hypothetical protein TUBRATIS_24970 [Tubulinosema ratisbonensis]|uniref:Uncharacterized protein n=1 Tax=Tubulinosema ratisbonensis TaxID=291195 RepID=A0A437AIY6_9MICR|nr:hypothetical protein TUBRATIS_24970 [Tubulinosema ratisbonensis]